MKVLKFGGSSVANSENIKKVLKIVSDASNETKIAVVVSAFGKTTDNLLAGANHALQNIELAKEQLEIIQKLHFEVINELIKTNITEVAEKANSLFSKVLSIYQGIFLLQELSAKTLAKVSSFGEKLSSFIIANAAKELFDATHQ
ncbi:MAG: bifunctional aspartate kinase/homoserine dehydrogenase I, partial [Polaribacter sp.]|nr:bifunctional aspartate kinase/homoserine dehydrogenase I [Polaribacter sp.]